MSPGKPDPLRIDAHHHFWRYSVEEYEWIDESMAPIRRDFLPCDLHQEVVNAKIDGVISVQARQSLEETEWLLSLASHEPWIRGVVGWAPLTESAIDDCLSHFHHSKLVGVRHVLQGEADRQYMLRDDFNRGVSRLNAYGLVYDILIFEDQLLATIEFVDRHPDQLFVLDHIAKPRIKQQLMLPWRKNIAALAKRPNVSCKLSGMVTEADPSHWNETQLQPYFETVIEAFTPARLMFGSDWPVCLVGVTYRKWLEVVSRQIQQLSQPEQAAILGGTATQVYL